LHCASVSLAEIVAQYETEALMTATRHRSAWIWLAVAAMSIAVVARAQSGMQNVRAYSSPVLEFLAAHSGELTAPANGAQRYLHPRSTRATVQEAHSHTLAAMLPVLFVGLVSPLNILSPGSILCIGRAPAAPLLPFSFQRPPPAILL
jgi:hypothetical protein